MNIQHTDNFYIKPEMQSESSKKVDKYLKYILISYVVATLFICLDHAFFHLGIGKLILVGPAFILWAMGALLIYLIAYFNGTFSRRHLPEKFVFDLISALKSKKVKENILAIIKLNNGISLRDLRLIYRKMEIELSEYYRNGYKEMLNLNDQLPAEKQKPITDLQNDVNNMKEFIVYIQRSAGSYK